MKQIYTNTTERVYLKIYKDGVLSNADNDPTYSILIPGSDTPRTGTSVSESAGVYYFVTDLGDSESQGVIKIDWTYYVNADEGHRVDYISVITPYTTFQDIKNLYPLESDIEIEHAELFSRFMINSYTGTDFGISNDTITMHGNDKATLVVPYRIERLDSIAVNNEVLWTKSPVDNTIVNDLGRTLSITDTHYGILSEKSDSVPSYDDFNEYSVWKKYSKYTISGLWGWANIPDEVEYSAKILADDYFCKETAWKKRFVEQINASDWRLVFNQKQFEGTGNFYVDSILREFRSTGMVLV